MLNMNNKTSFTAFRLTDIDFEFVRKQAKKQEITMSEYIRRLIKSKRIKKTGEEK